MKKIGIIGCGNISDVYLRNLNQAGTCQVVGVSDQIPARALEKANQYGVQALSVAEMLRDPEIFAVVNLTIPAVHSDVSGEVLAAGKHVYSEKPLALTMEQGKSLVAKSQEVGRWIGCAPDTVLGAGVQTARKVIDDGWIGRPVAATAFMTGHGHEGWHPDPAFFYQPGGGPLFDMGPYYLSALFQLLGPVRRVTGIASRSFSERIIRSAHRRGEHITVETPTHVSGSLEYANGVVTTLVMSFDVWHAVLPHIEIYGSEGTLSVPDPNGFGGSVKIRRFDAMQWTEIPLVYGPTDNARGLGVIDLVEATEQARMPRASGDIALHVLEIMEALLRSSAERCHLDIVSQPKRPLPMPINPEELPY